jgi:hypothetical protein
MYNETCVQRPPLKKWSLFKDEVSFVLAYLEVVFNTGLTVFMFTFLKLHKGPKHEKNRDLVSVIIYKPDHDRHKDNRGTI